MAERFTDAELETQKEYLNTLTSIRDIRREIAGLSKEELDILYGLDDVSEQLENAIKEQRKSIDASVISLERMVRQQRAVAKAAEGTSRELQEQEYLIEAQIELEKEKQLQRNKGTAEYTKGLEDIESLQKKLDELTEKISNNIGSAADNFKRAAEEGSKLLGSMLKLDNPAQAVGENLKSMTTSLMQGGKAKFLSKFPQLAKFAGPLGAVASVVAQIVGSIIELATEMVDTSNRIQFATGVNAQFADSITMGYKETRQFGGSLKDLETVAVDLSKTFTDFTMLNGDMAQSLARTGTLLGKLGVSSQDFAKGIQLSTKAFGMTVEEAEQAQLRLAALAQDIGVAPSQMAADFAAAGPQLAKFGNDAEATFKRLAVTAKSTGIEVNRLLSITEKFDTFEGAATQAGKLNAALGGNFVNAMELLTETDPAARFEMMTDAIKDAGLSFDDMSYYQKKFYAESMGLSDVNELALALSGNTDLLSQNLGKTSAEIEETAKRAQQMQSIQEQLNLLFADMVPIIEPAISMLRDFVSVLLDNKDTVKAVLGALIFGFGVFAFTIAPIPIAVGMITSALGILGHLLFRETWASSFLDGIMKIAKGFGFIAKMTGMASGGINDLTGDMDELGQSMFKGKSIKVGAEMTSTALEGMQDSTMTAASTTKAAAPVLATSSVVSSAVNKTTNTNNNYNTAPAKTEIEIKLAKGFNDLFQAKVKQGISKFARDSIIGG
jgi:hypothetical protein